MRTYHNGTWDGESIFVFGSNLAGIHGAGAARYALKNCGANFGQGVGLQGHSYAIPTKDQAIQTLSLFSIDNYVYFFKDFARINADWKFFVTALGTGLAGYNHSQIAPMFKDAPENCILPVEWRQFLDAPST